MVVPAELRQVADRARPVTLAREQTLPLVPVLQPLLPDGALARGSSVAVGGTGATSLALNLAAGPSHAGSWVVVVGLAELGLAAAAEAGLDLRRLALIDPPGDASWSGVVAALVGGIDVIVVDGRAPLTPSEGRRLAARARERGSVLVPVTPGSVPTGRRRGAWPADVTLTVTSGRWDGLGVGHGHLRRRLVRVETEGRGRASRPRELDLWLPAAPSFAGSNVAVGATTFEPAKEEGGGAGDATVVALRPVGRRAG
ncbi:MAG TPA: hypothetical protein VIY72_17080 [Acidimicrobiales bacterium]